MNFMSFRPQRLTEGHDRSQVTRKMQAIMMEKFKSST